jgi:hypothetical protein
MNKVPSCKTMAQFNKLLQIDNKFSKKVPGRGGGGGGGGGGLSPTRTHTCWKFDLQVNVVSLTETNAGMLGFQVCVIGCNKHL